MTRLETRTKESIVYASKSTEIDVHNESDLLTSSPYDGVTDLDLRKWI